MNGLLILQKYAFQITFEAYIRIPIYNLYECLSLTTSWEKCTDVQVFTILNGMAPMASCELVTPKGFSGHAMK